MNFSTTMAGGAVRGLVSLFWRHPLGPRAISLLTLANQVGGCGVVPTGLSKDNVARFCRLAALVVLGLAGDPGQHLAQTLGLV